MVLVFYIFYNYFKIKIEWHQLIFKLKFNKNDVFNIILTIAVTK